LTGFVTTTRNGQCNSKNIVESYSCKFRCFVNFPRDLQELGQRTIIDWLNGHEHRAWSPSEIVAIGEFHGVNMEQRVGSQKSEVRGQKSEIGGQRTGDGWQRAGGSRQDAEIRGQRSDVRKQKTDDRGRREET
jgi:hypothetical protein